MTIKKSFLKRLLGSRLLRGAALGLAGSLMACEAVDLDSFDDEVTAAEIEQAVIVKPSEVDPPGPQQVCWSSAAHSTERGWIQAVLTGDRSWSNFAEVDFQGWGLCPSSGFQGIRLNPDGTKWDEENGKWVGNTSCSSPVNGIQDCRFDLAGITYRTDRASIEGNALHEFGHALGFMHEHLHEGATCPKRQPGEAWVPELYSLGPADDWQSVMSYCGGNDLSEWDIAGVQAVYGQKWSNPSAVKTADLKLWVFARGTNDGLYYKTKTGSTWSSAWTSLGGTFKDAPVAVTMGNNRIDVFVRGSDNALWQKTYSGGKWQSYWTSLGGELKDSPAAVSITTGRIDVFVRYSNDHLRQLTYMNNKWLPWSGDMNIATISEAPTVISSTTSTFDIFFKGMNHEIYHMPYRNGAWKNYVSLGGFVTSAPGAVAMGADKLRVFARGVNQHLYEKTYTTAAGWPALWTQVNSGEDMTSGPGAIKTSSTTFSVFSRGEDDDMVELTNTNGTWATAWVSRGGVFH